MCCWLLSSCEIEEQSTRITHTLSLTLSGLRLPGWRGGQEQWVIYEPAWKRWEGPAIPCQEGTMRGERLRTLKCHFLQFTTSLSPLPLRPGWEMCRMKNGSHYKLDPSWSLQLTPTSYKCDPVAMSQPFHPLYTYTYIQIHARSHAETPTPIHSFSVPWVPSD